MQDKSVNGKKALVYLAAFTAMVRLPVITAFMGLISFPAMSDELDDLKSQLAELSRKVEHLEQLKKQETLTVEETIPAETLVTAGEVPGSWKIPGTDTSMRIDGFIRAHMIYDIGPRPTSTGGDVASIRSAILEGTPEFENRGDVRIAGRDARFNIATYTPTRFGRMYTFIQGDFKGDPDNKGSRATTNRTAFTLRHAYGELGNFLFGQTYSNYLDNSVFPDKVDPTGPVGRTMVRQGQIRYTHHLSNDSEFAVALENPRGDFHDADDNNLDDSYPDLTMHYRYETDRWLYQFSGMLRRIGIKDTLIGADDEVMGWALNHSGMFLLPGSEDRITWYINSGDGIGRYLEGGPDLGASVGVDGNLDTQFGYGGFVTYKHWWTDNLQSNLDFGISFFDLNPDEDPEANSKLYSSHINLIWTPIEQLEFGLEYVWGHREVHDGREGNVNRIHVNSVFYF